MKKALTLALFGLLFFVQNVFSQTFSEQAGIVLPSLKNSSIAWGDYDNDGDLDILMTGYNGVSNVSKIYRNNGSNVFAEQVSISIIGVSGGATAWSDYNNDGNLDFIISGVLQNVFPSQAITKIYKNNGNGTFTEQSSINLPGVFWSSIEWGDFDNDGYDDFLLTGMLSSSLKPLSKVYKNNGNNTFTAQNGIILENVQQSAVAWGDYDKDGDLDIVLSGDTAAYNINDCNCIQAIDTVGVAKFITRLYKNNGNGTFTKQSSINLPALINGSLAWGDYDNDGDLDILMAGGSKYDNTKIAITKILKNQGDTFVIQNTIAMTGLGNGSARWADFNNDGLLDVLVSGNTGVDNFTKLYKNNGNNTFTEQLGYGFSAVGGNFSAGDYDNDGKLDLVYIAINNLNVASAKVYKNTVATGNNAPSAPLNVKFNPLTKVLSWSKSTDDHTPSVGITYNIEVGSLNLPNKYYSGNASVTNGYRRVVAMGNCMLDTFVYIKLPANIHVDSTIYFRVQAVDNAYKASAFTSSTLMKGKITKNDASITCGGNVVLDVVSNYNLTTGITYAWTPTLGLSSSTVKNPVAKPGQTTTYKVVCTSLSGMLFTDSIKITVLPITVNAGSDFSKNCGDSTVFNPTTNYPGVSTNLSWAWTPGTGLSATNIKSPRVKPVATTNYIVHLTSTEGCSAYDTVTVTVNPFVVNAGIDITKVCGDSFTLAPTLVYGGSTTGMTYLWTPSTGLSSTTIKTPRAKPVVTTNYVLQVTSSTGCISRDTVKYTVSPVTLNLGLDVNKVCGDSIILNPLTNYPGLASKTNWTWSPGTKLSSTTIKNPIAKPIVNTTYIVNMSTTDGCTAKADTIVINIAQPSLYAGSDKNITCADSITLSPSTNYPGLSSKIIWAWTPNTKLSATNIQNPKAKPISTINYIINMTTTDGCVAKADTVKINVTPLYVKAGSDMTKICGDSVKLLPTTNYKGLASNITWLWSPGASLSSTAIMNPYAKPVVTTDFIVNMTTSEGCTAKDTIKITVNQPYVKAGLDITKTCGSSVTLSPTTNYRGKATNLIWSWSPTAGLNSSSIKNPIVKFNTTTDYIVNMSSIEGCTALPDTIKVISTTPVLSYGKDKVMNNGGSVHLLPVKNTYGGGLNTLTWTWTPTLGMIDATTESPLVKPLVTTTYIGRFVSPEGCATSDTIIVYTSVVKRDPFAIFDESESIDQELFVFPNPSNGNFTAQFDGELSSEYLMQVSSLLGDVVYSENIQTEDGKFVKKLDLNYLPKGIYFVSIQSENFRSVKKLIIQ